MFVKPIALFFTSAATLFVAAQTEAPLNRELFAVSKTGEKQFIWRDAGPMEQFDFAGGAGGVDGAPAPPFVFHEEESGGTSPKIIVKDANKRTWSVKFGPEVKAETFATRLVASMGYFVEPAYYVAKGNIDSVGRLSARAEAFINRSHGNSFESARFELRDQDATPLPTSNWAFDKNPFLNKPEFNGLRVMMMMLSNWDVKDARSSSGPNTAIIRVKKPDGSSELRYIVTDWGATMGKWGGIATRSKWDCAGYSNQTPQFVTGLNKNGYVGFGFEGKRKIDIVEGVKNADVRWLVHRLGRVTDDQLKAALQASGANETDTACFVTAIRSRINQLNTVAGEPVDVSSR